MREDVAELRLVRRACSRLHLDQIRPHGLDILLLVNIPICDNPLHKKAAYASRHFGDWRYPADTLRDCGPPSVWLASLAGLLRPRATDVSLAAQRCATTPFGKDIACEKLPASIDRQTGQAKVEAVHGGLLSVLTLKALAGC